MNIELLGQEPQDDALDSRDFYEVCQIYRHSPLGVEEFEFLKTWIRQNAAVNSSVTNPVYSHACETCAINQAMKEQP